MVRYNKYMENTRGGGTSIFIVDSVQIEERKYLKYDFHGDPMNSCFIQLDKHTINDRKNIILRYIYKPPHVSMANFNDFL